MSSVAIVSRMEPSRKWSAAEKAALLAEVEAEGGRVTLVARRHRISESLLYNWRSARKAAVAAASGLEPPEFLQLGVVG
jgi:transposase